MSAVLDKLRAFKDSVFGNGHGVQPPPFPETLSVESSYACNLKCVMCPRHFEGVPQGMFTLEMFEKHIEPHLHRFKYFHLTGWGEPLMNRDLPEMVRRARAKGLHTSFTSNGLLLKPPLDRTLIETGLDRLNVSCDADNPEMYEQVRGKGTFDILIERLKNFHKLRKEMNSPMELTWGFVMMRSNFHTLPGVVRLAAECGFNSIGAKHMESAITREDMREALWNTGIVDDVPADVIAAHDASIAEAFRVAKEVGIDLFVHRRRMNHNGACIVRPVESIFIDYEGRVSPCCFLNKNDVRRYNTEAERPADDGIMGELKLGDLVKILEGDRYRAFQKSWMDGKPPEACRNCMLVARMNTNSTDPTNYGEDRIY